MNPTTSFLRRTLAVSLSLVILSLTLPAWADSRGNPSLKKALTPEQSISGKDDKQPDHNSSRREVNEESGKGGKSIKKSAAKKAGAAAAAGVAGAAVKARLKD